MQVPQDDVGALGWVPPHMQHGLGKYVGSPVELQVRPDVKPIFLKARSVPYARREAVSQELDRLVELDIIAPIDESDWATPIVCVDKPDGSIRTCGDYRSAVNQALRPDHYPLPTLQEAFAKLAGGTCFSKIDLRLAYQQVPLTEPTSKLLTITTHKGPQTTQQSPNSSWACRCGPPTTSWEKRVGWLPGVITEQRGSVIYVFCLQSGDYLTRRRIQLRRRVSMSCLPGDYTLLLDSNDLLDDGEQSDTRPSWWEMAESDDPWNSLATQMQDEVMTIPPSPAASKPTVSVPRGFLLA